MRCDYGILSEHQICIRKQIEYFEAGPSEVFLAHSRKREIHIGQVGIRCKHCTILPPSRRPKGAIYYPTSLQALYQAAQNMTTGHFVDSCKSIDINSQEQLQNFKESQVSSSHGGKKYWADCAKALGIIEMEQGGLCYGSTSFKIP